MVANLEKQKGTSLWQDAWKRLLKNRLAVFGMIVLAIMIVAVIVGPRIIYLTTGFTADFIPSQMDEGDLVRSFPPSWQHPMGTDDAGRDLLARVLQGGRISLTVGIISTLVSLLVGVSYGAVAGYMGGSVDNVMMRIVDIIYAIPYILIVIVLLSAFGGSNTTVLVGWLPQILIFLVILIALIFSAVFLFRKLFNERSVYQSRPVELLLKFLYFVAAAAVIGVVSYFAAYAVSETNAGAWLAEKYTANVNQGLSQIFLLFLSLGLISWLTMARVVRGQVLSLRNEEFVTAARANGTSPLGIIFKHLVPNALGPVIVYATLTVPSVMLAEAFLSFLGMGVQAPYASWGSLAADGIKNISIFPWQLLFPGITMAITLFSLNFLGDGLRDALDPQTRKF